METVTKPIEADDAARQRAQILLRGYQFQLWKQTDQLFAILLIVQWIAGMAVAAWLSPWAWEGIERHIHPHIWASVFLGGAIAVGPVVLAIFRPGQTLTRMSISVAQVLHSALLIHLSGGRIETHFHVFGSLAFLSFYRDWRVLVPATLVVAIDHAARGIFWPESVFGISNASSWRWLEHAGWVIFEDICLIWGCVRGARELAALANRQAELETANTRVEAEVARQTARLESVSQELVSTARRAGMAEIATGVLHNVGNVLNSVNVSVSVAVNKVQKSEVSGLVKVGKMIESNKSNLVNFLTDDERGKHVPDFLIEVIDCIGAEQNNLLKELRSVVTGLDHIKEIVSAQQRHAKDGKVRQKLSPAALFDMAVEMDLGSSSEQPAAIVRNYEEIPAAAVDKHKVLQVLINLLSNAKRAVNASSNPHKRINLSTHLIDGPSGKRIQFEICDNGVGIRTENLARIFSHGFTTRPDGHGFGLHSAANAAREMGGNISATSEGEGCGASFILELPFETLSTTEELIARKKDVPCATN